MPQKAIEVQVNSMSTSLDTVAATTTQDSSSGAPSLSQETKVKLLIKNVSYWLKLKSKNVKYDFTKRDSFTQESDPLATPFAAGAGDGTQGTRPPDKATLLAQRRARKQGRRLKKAINDIALQAAKAVPSAEVVANAVANIKQEMSDEYVESIWDSGQLVRPAVSPDSNGHELVELAEVQL